MACRAVALAKADGGGSLVFCVVMNGWQDVFSTLPVLLRNPPRPRRGIFNPPCHVVALPSVGGEFSTPPKEEKNKTAQEIRRSGS